VLIVFSQIALPVQCTPAASKIRLAFSRLAIAKVVRRCHALHQQLA
jgi:hypothetical protein